MSYIINVAKLADLVSTEKNQYSYTRLKNIMSGVKKRSKRSEIQKVRQVLKTEFMKMDKMLKELEEDGI